MKVRIIFTVTLVVATLFLGACFRQDIRILVVRVPGMKTTECSKIIQNALGKVEGIISVQPDLENRTMTVEYNSTKLAIKNIEYTIAEAGFDANDAEGKAEAKQSLPPDCR